jgi:hypothetical protein
MPESDTVAGHSLRTDVIRSACTRRRMERSDGGSRRDSYPEQGVLAHVVVHVRRQEQEGPHQQAPDRAQGQLVPDRPGQVRQVPHRREGQEALEGSDVLGGARASVQRQTAGPDHRRGEDRQDARQGRVRHPLTARALVRASASTSCLAGDGDWHRFCASVPACSRPAPCRNAAENPHVLRSVARRTAARVRGALILAWSHLRTAPHPAGDEAGARREQP